jgi:UDP-4-amino-4,6-dideoxy-N-acetyl-beta-L-altrosamine N-acetyltransferase
LIIGKRIQLRAIEYEDLPLMVEWRNNPEIYKYFFEHEPTSLIMQTRWFEKYISCQDEKLWIIEDIVAHSSIGTIGLVNIDWRNRKAEFGRFFIGSKNYHHNGYGSEAVSLILQYFFNHMNMNRLYGFVFSDNTHVLDLYEKFGFIQESKFNQYIYREGEYADIVCVAILREFYLSEKTQKIISQYI